MKATYRWLISLLAAGFALAYAVPLLPLHGTPLQFGFSVLWLSFCLLVIAANLHALLGLGKERQPLTREEREALKRVYRAAYGRRLPLR